MLYMFFFQLNRHMHEHRHIFSVCVYVFGLKFRKRNFFFNTKKENQKICNDILTKQMYIYKLIHMCELYRYPSVKGKQRHTKNEYIYELCGRSMTELKVFVLMFFSYKKKIQQKWRRPLFYSFQIKYKSSQIVFTWKFSIFHYRSTYFRKIIGPNLCKPIYFIHINSKDNSNPKKNFYKSFFHRIFYHSTLYYASQTTQSRDWVCHYFVFFQGYEPHKKKQVVRFWRLGFSSGSVQVVIQLEIKFLCERYFSREKLAFLRF